MKKSLLGLFLALLICGAAWANVDCYVGSDKLGSVSSQIIDGGIWVPVEELARMLGMDVESSGEEVTISNKSVRLKIVENAGAAWSGTRLISLHSTPKNINGGLWIDDKSVNVLFRGVSKKNISIRSASEVESVQRQNPIAKSRETILYNAPNVKDERTQAPLTPPPSITAQPDNVVSLSPDSAAPKSNLQKSNLPKITDIRWSSTVQKIRVVLVCDGDKEPTLRKDGVSKIAVGPVDFQGLSLNSEYPDKVQLKEENGSLIFMGKWKKVDVIALKNPKRIVMDFFVDPKAQPLQPEPAKMPEPALPVLSNVPDESSSKLVVIDPGHGGQDPGAVGNGLREKDINLAIGLKLEKVLKSKGLKVEMTRRTDVYLKLNERTAMANKWGAEVFISVHANALPKGKTATGFEIYIMALPTDRDALELAKFENRELVNGKMNVEASDKSTQLLVKKLSEQEQKKVSIILGDMKQNDKITRSTLMTESMFKAGNANGLPMKRVAQAPFFVLRGTDNMAAVLLETGFITDPRESKLLAHPGYQQRIADSMAAGVVSYLGGK